jgi:HEAT repeat protein
MGGSKSPILYINYASSDAEFALQLAADLKNAGIAAWMERLQLPASMDWQGRIAKALDQAAGMLVILSLDWFQSRYCLREYESARQRGLPIFAVALRPIAEHEYPPAIDTQRTVDFSEWRSERVYRERFRRLFARLKEDNAAWIRIQPDNESRYLVQIVARMEAAQGTLEYLPIGEQGIHVSCESEQRTPPALSALWGNPAQVVVLDKVRNAPTAEPRWRRSSADIKAALARRPHALLLGAPGTGKTTVLQRLTLDAARARLADPSLPVPVYVNLAHWSDEQDFESFLLSRAPMLRNVIDMATDGSAILYIDGLNEITQHTARGILQIRAWLSSQRAPQRVLFACRTRHYDDTLDLDLPMLELEMLDDETVWNIVRACVGDRAAENAFRKIYAPESAHPVDAQTRELARNVTLLQGLIFLYKSAPDGTMPATLGSLLKRWMAALWVWKRMAAMPAWMPFKDVEAALAKLAFTIVDKDLPTGMAYGDTLQLLLEDKLLRAAQNAGLIDIEADVVAFRQPVIAEYFAAVGASRFQASSQLQPPHFNSWGERIATRWDMPMTVLAGLLPNADEIVAEIGKTDPFLAAQVLAGGVEATQQSRDASIKLLVEITHFVTGEGRLAAVRALADLNHPETLLALLDVMRSGTWQVRQAANWLLHRLQLPVPRELFTAVQDWNWTMDEKVAIALRTVGVQALPLLLQVLRDEQWTRRRGAAWALGEVGDAAAVPGLVEALADDESLVRREAAMALRMLGDVDALPMLIDALRDPDARVRKSVSEAVVSFKAHALPGLVDLLRDPAVALKRVGLEAIAAIGDSNAAAAVVPLLQNRNAEMRALAIAVLGRMKSADAVAPLIEALKDDERLPRSEHTVSDLAARALNEIDTEEARAALETLRGKKAEGMFTKSGSAAKAVIRLPGRKDAETQRQPLSLSQLREKLVSSDWRQRKLAVQALTDVEPGNKVPALLEALRDEDSQVRHAAVIALDGVHGDAVVWGLIEALRDGDHLVADTATAQLARMGQYAVPDLMNALFEEDVNVRGRAVEALGEIGDPAAVPRLIPLLQDTLHPVMERERICDKAARALETIGEEAGLAAVRAWRDSNGSVPVPNLILSSNGHMTDETQEVNGLSFGWDENSDLLPYDPDESTKPAYPFEYDELPLAVDEYMPDEPFVREMTHQQLGGMLQQLHAPDWRERQLAARELREHTRKIGGIADESFAEQLIGALGDPEQNVRWAVTEALAWIHHPSVPPALAAMLQDGSWTVRLAALQALFEHDDKRVASAVIAALKDENELVRESAAELLGKVVSDAGALALIEVLKDSKGFVRRAAADALGALKARAAVQPLIRALDDDDHQVRFAAAEALGKLGDEAALRPLVRLLRKHETTAWEERPLEDVAAEALTRIGTPEAKRVVAEWRKLKSAARTK